MNFIIFINLDTTSGRSCGDDHLAVDVIADDVRPSPVDVGENHILLSAYDDTLFFIDDELLFDHPHLVVVSIEFSHYDFYLVRRVEKIVSRFLVLLIISIIGGIE